MSEILYAYGTLRTGVGPVVAVPGRLYDLGWFPGLKLGGTDLVICEKQEVVDWGQLDRYEGYIEEAPEESLFVRRPFLDGYIYEFNRSVNPVKQILNGDWLEYTKNERV